MIMWNSCFIGFPRFYRTTFAHTYTNTIAGYTVADVYETRFVRGKKTAIIYLFIYFFIAAHLLLHRFPSPNFSFRRYFFFVYCSYKKTKKNSIYTTSVYYTFCISRFFFGFFIVIIIIIQSKISAGNATRGRYSRENLFTSRVLYAMCTLLWRDDKDRKNSRTAAPEDPVQCNVVDISYGLRSINCKWIANKKTVCLSNKKKNPPV